MTRDFLFSFRFIVASRIISIAINIHRFLLKLNIQLLSEVVNKHIGYKKRIDLFSCAPFLDVASSNRSVNFFFF